MKINKTTPLKKIIAKLVEVSFVGGQLYQPKIDQIVKTLGGLSKGVAITTLKMYLSGLKRHLNSSRLTIETATPLTHDQIKKIESAISQRTPVLETEVIINPKLLGGLKLKIGDLVLEDSMVSRIAQMKEAIRG